jgi:hypothetical protein
MFTIHGIKNGHYVPLVFCLLPSSIRRHLIYVIKSKFIMLRLNFEPREVVVDFEKSISRSCKGNVAKRETNWLQIPFIAILDSKN